MIPVTQTREGFPFGNCVQASYSAIFEVPLECIPRFDPAAAAELGTTQDVYERKWLASLGLDLVEVAVPATENLPQEVLDRVPPIPHLMSGVSPRGFCHRCVGVGGQLVWDPHPSRAGLLTVYSIGLLLPLER